MNRKYWLAPLGWPCTLDQCEPGPFMYEGRLGFKSEYVSDGVMEAYNCGGEMFWAGCKSEDERRQVIVQPVSVEEDGGQ